MAEGTARKSTNVRIVGAALRALAVLAPRVAARIAAALFFRTPPRRRARPSERAVLESGERFELDLGGGRLAGWRWGSGRPVLLVHGWGGSAAQMTALVRPLLNEGLSPIAIDLPGHGASAGTSTSI